MSSQACRSFTTVVSDVGGPVNKHVVWTTSVVTEVKQHKAEEEIEKYQVISNELIILFSDTINIPIRESRVFLFPLCH